MVRVLVVGDARFRAAAARGLVGPAVGVAGEAESAELSTAVRRLQPDLVVIGDAPADLRAVTDAMHLVPARVLVMGEAGDPTLEARAVAAGALDAIARLPLPTDPGYAAHRDRLVRRVRALATVPVVRRTGEPRSVTRPLGWVLLGASTGGPQALEVVLSRVPAPFPLPIVIAQHVTAGFDGALAEWLGKATGHAVRLVEALSPMEPGQVWLAPERAHTVVRRPGVLVLEPGEPRNFHRPSIDALFESAAGVLGPRVFAALLTGMGRDGAAGLLALRRAGATTAAQLPAECVVDSMPQAAIGLGAAGTVGTLAQLAALVARLPQG